MTAGFDLLPAYAIPGASGMLLGPVASWILLGIVFATACLFLWLTEREAPMRPRSRRTLRLTHHHPTP